MRARLQSWLHQRWYSAGEVRDKTHPIDRLINRRLLDRRERSVQLNRRQQPPVIIVGNLVAGGGGKSPMVLHLAKQLQLAGKTVAIIASGYGGTARHAREVTAQDDSRVHSDEAVMLARLSAARVFAGARRTQAYALAVAKAAPDLVISDDGLQHFELPRALQLVCVDERLFGNQRPLPFGPLREPLDVLKQVDALIIAQELAPTRVTELTQNYPIAVFTTTTAAVQLRQFHGEVVSNTTSAAPTAFDLSSPEQREAAGATLVASHSNATGVPIDLVAGIANPAAFENLVKTTFGPIRAQLVDLADHQWPSNTLLQQLVNRPVIMTEKDAVKWAQAARALHLTPPHWWILSIERRTVPDLGQFVLEHLA